MPPRLPVGEIAGASFDKLAKPLAIFRRADFIRIHGEELLATKTIVLDRCVVHGQKAHAVIFQHPHRNRVVLEQQAK